MRSSRKRKWGIQEASYSATTSLRRGKRSKIPPKMNSPASTGSASWKSSMKERGTSPRSSSP